MIEKLLLATERMNLGEVVATKPPKALYMERVIREAEISEKHKSALSQLMSVLTGLTIEAGEAAMQMVEYALGGVVVVVQNNYALTYPEGVPLIIVNIDEDRTAEAVDAMGNKGNWLPSRPNKGDIRKATPEEIEKFVHAADYKLVKQVEELG